MHLQLASSESSYFPQLWIPLHLSSGEIQYPLEGHFSWSHTDAGSKISVQVALNPPEPTALSALKNLQTEAEQLKQYNNNGRDKNEKMMELDRKENILILTKLWAFQSQKQIHEFHWKALHHKVQQEADSGLARHEQRHLDNHELRVGSTWISLWLSIKRGWDTYRQDHLQWGKIQKIKALCVWVEQ